MAKAITTSVFSKKSRLVWALLLLALSPAHLLTAQTAALDVQNNNAAQPILKAASNDGTVRMTILDNGFIGIDTTSPGGSLQVKGGIRARGGAPGSFGLNNNGYAFGGNSGDDDSGMFCSGDGQLEFFTNNNEWVRINDLGYVGIDTTNPSERLHVNGNILSGQAVRARGGSLGAFGANNNGFSFSGNGGDTDGGMFSSADGQLEFYTSNVERIRINPSGNVGVGTSSPSERLHVSGNILSGQAVRARGGSPGASGANNNGFSFSGNGGDNDSGMFSSADGQLEFYTNNVERIRVNPSGNVGIGTTSPSTILHISGIGALNAIRMEDTSGAVVRINGNYNSVGGTYPHIGTTGDFPFGIIVDGSYSIFANDNGNVGIGTTSPTNQLTVSGNANFTGNVGIGIANPTERLHVNGNIRLADDADILGTDIIQGFNDLRLQGDPNGSHDVLIDAAGQVFIFNMDFFDGQNVQRDASTKELGYDNSSRRHKENITDLAADWQRLLDARPVTYTRPGRPGRWEIGFIAEEIDSLGLTSLVTYDAEGKPDGVNYEKMVTWFVPILRGQRAQIEAQQQEIAALKTQAGEMFWWKLLVGGLALVVFVQLTGFGKPGELRGLVTKAKKLSPKLAFRFPGAALLLLPLLFTQCIASFESARMLPKGSAELKGAFSHARVEGETFNTGGGIGFGYGVSDRVNLKAGYERLAPAEGEDQNLVGLASKFAIVPGKVAFLLPAGLVFNSETDAWFTSPAVLCTISPSRHFEATLVAHTDFLFDDETEFMYGFDLGFGLSADLDRWAVRPDLGIIFDPAENERVWSFGIGFNYTLPKKGD